MAVLVRAFVIQTYAMLQQNRTWAWICNTFLITHFFTFFFFQFHIYWIVLLVLLSSLISTFMLYWKFKIHKRSKAEINNLSLIFDIKGFIRWVWITPYSCRLIHAGPIHADRFMPTDSCPLWPIHARAYSCQGLFMPIRTYSCRNLFMPRLIHALKIPKKYLWIIHARTFSCPDLFMPHMTFSCQFPFMPASTLFMPYPFHA